MGLKLPNASVLSILVAAGSILASAEPRIAVLDTGYSQEKAKVTLKTQILSGRNVMDPNDNVVDQSGHGTLLTDEISKVCPHVGILPIKVSRLGSAIDPKEVAQGIDWAVAQNAQVINLSFGILGNSKELDQAIERATLKKVTIVTAAGMGVPNPYKPSSLSEFIPQSNPNVIVVGSSLDSAQFDPNQNYGPELDLVVLPPQSKNPNKDLPWSSSLASAQIAGKIACMDAKKERTPKGVLAQLRAATGQSGRYLPDYFGYGIVRNVQELKFGIEGSRTRVRRYSFPEQQTGFDMSAEKEIKKIWPISECAKKILKAHRPEILKKGRAHLVVNSPLLNECTLSVRVFYNDGLQEDLDLNSATSLLGDKPF